MGGATIVRPYRPSDEQAWLRCRVLAFLGTAFYDDVLRAKEHYEHEAIELVAERDGEVVGLLDAECDSEPGSVCSTRPGLGAMIWHFAVHPDHQGTSVGTALLHEASTIARARGIARFEAWTRDDAATRAWYERNAFEIVDRYHHVYVEFDEGLRDMFPITPDGIRPVRLFAHYLGDDADALRQRFARVHEDVLYERRLDDVDDSDAAEQVSKR